jgi:hypothetical protein
LAIKSGFLIQKLKVYLCGFKGRYTFSFISGTILKPYLKQILWCFLLISGPVFSQNEPVPVADLLVNIPGTEEAEKWVASHPKEPFNWPVYYYGFQKGDEFLVDLKAEGKATYFLEIKEYGSGSVIFTDDNITKLKRLRLPVPQKMVYEFTIKSNAAEKSFCKLTIQRISPYGGAKHFNTNVTWQMRPDTAYTYADTKVLVKKELQPQVLVDKTFRVFSQASIGNPSRVTIPFKLPAKTKHWVYWIGVGQESVKELEEMTKSISKGGAAVLGGFNPVAAFGMGLLPQLPQVKSSGYVNYLFMNKAAVAPFEEEGTRKPYSFAQGNAVVSDYGKITATQTPKTTDGTLYMGVENKNTVTGLDVNVRIIAFTTEDLYETRRVKKIAKITQKRVPVFGE